MSSCRNRICNQCRACCSKNCNDMISIESLQNSEEMISLLLYLNLEIIQDLPNEFCTECMKKIENIIHFKKQCATSLTILQNILNSLDNEKNVKLETDIKYEADTDTCFSSDIKDESLSEEETTIRLEKCFKEPIIEKHGAVSQDTSCNICQKTFNNNSNLKRHKLLHQSDKPKFFCHECNKFYASIDSYDGHKRRFHGKHPVIKTVCTHCGKSVFNIKLHMNMRHTIDKIKCSFCEKVLKNQESLKRHVKLHENDGIKLLSLCAICGKVFSDLKLHIRSKHSNERNYKCQYCTKTFKTNSHQKKHERIEHLKERPFKCEYCMKAFGTKTVLESHIRTHTGEKPFVCSICSRAFAQKVALRTHTKLVHGSKLKFHKNKATFTTD